MVSNYVLLQVPVSESTFEPFVEAVNKEVETNFLKFTINGECSHLWFICEQKLMPHIWVTEHGYIKIAITCTLNPYWLASMVLEGAMPIIREEKLALISQSCEPEWRMYLQPLGGNQGLQQQ